MKDPCALFGNRYRAKLIVCLSRGTKNVTELIRNCSLSQSAVSQHLAKLRLAGVVGTTRRGKEIRYRLLDKTAGNIAKLLMSYSTKEE